MVRFNDIYPQFLASLKSNTLAEMSTDDLEEYLDELMIKAVAAFWFPRVSLEYTSDSDGYYFVEDIRQQEINVLGVLMKRYWLEQQLDDENKMEQKYYDSSIKTHSQANMIKVMQSRFEEAKKECEVVQYNYSRTDDYQPTITNIYE